MRSTERLISARSIVQTVWNRVFQNHPLIMTSHFCAPLGLFSISLWGGQLSSLL